MSVAGWWGDSLVEALAMSSWPCSVPCSIHCERRELTPGSWHLTSWHMCPRSHMYIVTHIHHTWSHTHTIIYTIHVCIQSYTYTTIHAQLHTNIITYTHNHTYTIIYAHNHTPLFEHNHKHTTIHTQLYIHIITHNYAHIIIHNYTYTNNKLKCKRIDCGICFMECF